MGPLSLNLNVLGDQLCNYQIAVTYLKQWQPWLQLLVSGAAARPSFFKLTHNYYCQTRNEESSTLKYALDRK